MNEYSEEHDIDDNELYTNMTSGERIALSGGLSCPECERKDKALDDIKEALSIALQYVPLEGKDKDEQKEIDEIDFLVKRAT